MIGKLEIEKLLQTKHSLNEEQRLAIECFDNSVVKAGAGAGKTTVLSYRFLNLILKNQANCDEILTLTFTKKAAAEMFERIYKQLLAIKDSSAFMNHQFSLFSKATISTIDSFCNQIVKQDCMRYGIPSDFLIDNNKASDITKRCTQQLIENDDMLPGFKFLSKAYSPNDLIDKIIVNLANNSFYFPLELDKGKLFEECDLLIDNTIKDNLDRLFDLFDNILNQDYQSLTKATSTTLIQLKEYRDILNTLSTNSENFYQELCKISFTTPRKNKDPFSEILVSNCKELKEVISELISLNFIKNNNHLVEVVNALEVLKNKIFEEKRKLGILTFSDISHLAVDILLTNKKIRQLYKEKFKFIMIDEFQDNNQLQKDLTYLLSEKYDLLGDDIPDVFSIEKRKLFFVGDEKQSIYRFRDADVSVFKALSNEIKQSGGKVINLGINYRSEPKLIKFFNQTFSKVFSNAEKPFEANFEELAYRNPIPNINPKIELYIKDSDSFSLVKVGEESASSASCEATKIAKIINTMLNSDDYLIPAKDGGFRRPNVNDIAILIRTKTHQIEFEKALRAKKIPFIIQDNKAYPLEALSNDLYNILQLLVYPDDKLAYLSVLKGPLGALHESSIIKILENHDSENLFNWENINLEEKDLLKLKELKNIFDELIELSSISDISSLLNYIWWDAGLRYYYVCEPNYHLYIDNFDYLYRLAKKYDSNQYSLSIYLDNVRDNLGSSSNEEEVSVLKESPKGVQIMTIHKSKGLEFPIVIVANMGTEIINRKVDYSTEHNIPVPKHCLSIDKKTNKVKFDSLFITKAKELRGEMELAEIKRVLYVALTRAQVHLIMSGTIRSTIEDSVIGKENKSLLNMIYNAALENDQINPLLEIKDIEIVNSYENYVKVENKPIVERTQYKKNLEYYNVCKEEYDTRLKNIGVTTLFGHKDDGNFEDGAALPLSQVDKMLSELNEINKNVYTDFGTLCHIYVQSLVMNKPLLGLIDERVLSRGSSLSKLKPTEIKAIENIAKSYASDFINSDFYHKYVEKFECKCEVGFFSRVDDEVGESLVVEGFIDLLVKDDENNYLIIDFKTDKVRNPKLHEMQIKTYITAVKRMYPNSHVTGCVVYLRNKDKEYFY